MTWVEVPGSGTKQKWGVRIVVCAAADLKVELPMNIFLHPFEQAKHQAVLTPASAWVSVSQVFLSPAASRCSLRVP